MASSYILVLGPQCRNCSVASVTSMLCYIQQLSAPAMPAVRPSCHAVAQAGMGRSSQRGGLPERAGWRGRTFTFPNRNVASTLGQEGHCYNLRLARLGKKERERCKQRFGNFLEQVAYPCLRAAMRSAHILISLGLIDGMGYREV